ncbi:hypothetical protein [Janibacter sp. G1551]|uniref:hypothetical protein n=1 Tax=Janibacter sp. G1551 TaxID=3420440 RepID=UPI003D01D0EB
MTELIDPDWTTPAGLAEIREAVAASIDGWRPPVMWGVGITSASSTPDVEFPHVNGPTDGTTLSGVLVAKALGHDGSTATLDLTTEQLASVVEALSPAEACTEVHHPNLAAFRQLLGEAEDNPARSLVAVFVGDLDDPVGSEADGAMRAFALPHGECQ